jgi:hypothetical protein
VSLTGSGYCRATFTLNDGKVTKVEYTAANSQLAAPQSICAPIVKLVFQSLNSQVRTLLHANCQSRF